MNRPAEQDVQGPNARASIKQVAAQLFAARGYHSTTLRQLATAAGITLGTLYHYYPSKEDLLAELVDDAMRPLLATLDDVRARARDDAVAALREMVESFIRVALEELGTVLVLIADNELRALSPLRLQHALVQRDAYEQAMIALVEEGRRRGEFAVDHVKLAVYAILAICNSVPRWYKSDGPLSAEETARINATLALRLVGVDPARS
jgi:AcrR family transcriptional regulator